MRLARHLRRQSKRHNAASRIQRETGETMPNDTASYVRLREAIIRNLPLHFKLHIVMQRAGCVRLSLRSAKCQLQACIHKFTGLLVFATT